MLVDNKVNVNLPDLYGDTALHFAARYRFDKIVNILVNHGANVNAPDGFGGSALGSAVSSGKFTFYSCTIKSKKNKT